MVDDPKSDSLAVKCTINFLFSDGSSPALSIQMHNQWLGTSVRVRMFAFCWEIRIQTAFDDLLQVLNCVGLSIADAHMPRIHHFGFTATWDGCRNAPRHFLHEISSIGSCLPCLALVACHSGDSRTSDDGLLHHELIECHPEAISGLERGDWIAMEGPQSTHRHGVHVIQWLTRGTYILCVFFYVILKISMCVFVFTAYVRMHIFTFIYY